MWFQGERGNWQSVLCYGVLFFKDLVERCWHLVQSCSVEIPPGLEGQAPDCLTSFTHWMCPSPYSALTMQSTGVILTGE